MSFHAISDHLCDCGCGVHTPLDRSGEPRRFRNVTHSRYGEGGFFNRYDEQDTGHSSPCRIWTGGRRSDGYGSIVIAGVQQLVHRVIYEKERGAIPDGLTIDHLCGTKLCVNPDHLEAVTPAENASRAMKKRWWAA